MMSAGPILMSRANPDGRTLEDVLSTLATELEAKCEEVVGDERPAARTLLTNNQTIISLLRQAEMLQAAGAHRWVRIGTNQTLLPRQVQIGASIRKFRSRTGPWQTNQIDPKPKFGASALGLAA